MYAGDVLGIVAKDLDVGIGAVAYDILDCMVHTGCVSECALFNVYIKNLLLDVLDLDELSHLVVVFIIMCVNRPCRDSVNIVDNDIRILPLPCAKESALEGNIGKLVAERRCRKLGDDNVLVSLNNR